jgi:DHA1 family tetracycline resistance protein-like MFS transporter
MAARKPAIGFALTLLAIDALGIGLVIPIVPQLVLELSGGDASHAARWVGLLAASFSAMQFIFSPVLGGLSDRFGRRPVLLLSVFGLAVVYFLLAISPSLGFVLFARLLAGVTTGNISAVTAYIADVTPPERRGQRFGLIGATFGLGFVLGPVVGGVLGGIWIRLPFLAAGGLALCNALYGFLLLPESLPKDQRRAFSWRRANPVSALLGLRANPRALRLAFAWSFTWFGLGALQSAFVLSTGLRFGWHTSENGFVLALAGLCQAVVQTFFIRRILGRLGEGRTALLGCLVAALAQSVYAFAVAGWMIYLAVMISALGAINTPAIRALFSAEAPTDRQGEAQGVLAALQSLTAIFAPLLGAALFAHFTQPGVAIFFPGAPFLLAAFAYLTAGALLARVIARAPPAPR